MALKAKTPTPTSTSTEAVPVNEADGDLATQEVIDSPPPVANDHVEEGSGLFDEFEKPAPKRSLGARVKDIEKRYGKEFTEVIIDIHDHVFGAVPEYVESETEEAPE